MIKIVEVGPRDGLQNETQTIPTRTKVDFVNALSASGVHEIEVTAFVSPHRVPQLKDAEEVLEKIRRHPNVVYSALIPNSRGLDRALESGVDRISLFTAASESFNRKNINTDLEGSLKRFTPVLSRARSMKLPVRVYISTAFWCPFEGKISPGQVTDLCLRLMDMGVEELSISDTIGKAAPDEVAALLERLLPQIPPEHIAVHFHDTYGRGRANVLESVFHGIQIIDASAGGLGGCPFAPGATGNVGTQAVVQALEDAGFSTGVDMEALSAAVELLSPWIPSPTPPTKETLCCTTCEFSEDRGCRKTRG